MPRGIGPTGQPILELKPSCMLSELWVSAQLANGEHLRAEAAQLSFDTSPEL